MDREGGTGGGHTGEPMFNTELVDVLPNRSQMLRGRVQRHSLWIFSILSKMAVVVVEKKLDRVHVGKIVKLGNHDFINLSYSLSKK